MKNDKPIFIFLDHDGVTHNWKDWSNPLYKMGTVIESITQNSGYHALNRIFLDNKLHANLIPISSWGNILIDFSESTKALQDAGINNLHLIESDENNKTELCEYNSKLSLSSADVRVNYIQVMIQKLNLQPKDYIILDDELDYMYKENGLSYIKTDMYEGISLKDIKKLEKHFGI